MVVMAAVVTVQAIFFADGGITALGANLLTLAVVAPLVGRSIWVLITSVSNTRGARLTASFAAAWTACVSAALVAAVLLWLSARAPLMVIAGAMGFWHALIGLGEGFITAGLVGYLLAVRPDLLAKTGSSSERVPGKVALTLGGLAIAAAAASFLASSAPDGLEFAYEHVGGVLDDVATLGGVMPDYVLPGIADETLAGVLAGLVGVVITGALAFVGLSGLRSRSARRAESTE
jgi:cobalt/nickel transport system permease protein